jgi:hypothetical protein
MNPDTFAVKELQVILPLETTILPENVILEELVPPVILSTEIVSTVKADASI